jgi:signal transduction histidine kinase
MSARRIAPWAAVLVTIASATVALVLDAHAGEHADGAVAAVPWIAATFASVGIGFLVATRRPGNPIGWLLLVNGLVLILHAVVSTYVNYAVQEDPGALPGGEWAVLIEQRSWPTLFVAFTAIAFVFPDGRLLPTRRWRRMAIVGIASFAVLIVVALFEREKYPAELAHMASPLPELPEALVGIAFMLSALGTLVTLVASVVAVGTRMRRSTGVERQQLKWLAYAAALVPASVLACFVENRVTGNEGIVTTVGTGVALGAFPLGVGIAVLRYRLYEIDRLINRTLVYALLTAGLAATFALVSLSVGVAIGSGSTVATAAATLAVAALFGPLRSRVQLAVDRRFDRARYDALRRIVRFLEDLRAGRAAPEEIGAVLAEAVGDPGLELLFWLPDEAIHVDADGREAEPAVGSGRVCTPVRRGDLPLASIVHDAALAERPDLLDGVIRWAGLAVEIGRLRVEVRRRLAEVEDSRARIVTAGYEERRRLERDIHDGAQQRLVSIGLALRHVQGRLPGDGEEAALLHETVAEVGRAIDELRELARGVRPPGLDDGLGPALGQLASRSRLRTSVEATKERFDDRIETAAYFVASEALANAAKHAGASSVRIVAARQNGTLKVSVRDDGVGGARPGEGTGLAGIADRVAALGGHLSVDSPAGAGTVVTAELPCAS